MPSRLSLPSPRLLSWAAIVAITALAAFLRFWQLDSVPPGFHYDEALEALEAWRVWHWPNYHPVFFPGDFGLSAMFIYLDALAFRLLGYAPHVARGVAAVVGVVTVPALYMSANELRRADERIPSAMPLLAAAVLAILRWHITFSRIAIESGLVPLFLVLIFWAFYHGLRTNAIRAWIGLGVALGLSSYTYPAAWLFPPLMIGYLVYVGLLAPHRIKGRWRGLLLAGLIACLIALPLGIHFLQHPAQLIMRSGQVSVISASHSTDETLAMLGHNVLKALGLFSFTGDIDARNNVPGMPALDLLIAVPFYLGVLMALWRWKHPAFGGLLLMAAAMIAPTVLSQYTPHFRRAIGLTPIIAMLSGLGLATILGKPDTQSAGTILPIPRRLQGLELDERELGGQMNRLRAWSRGIVVVAILLGSGILSTTTYFVRWARSPDLYYAYDEGLWEIAQYVLTLPEDELIYVSPRPARDATLAFAWREGPETQHFDGRHAFIMPAYVPETDRDVTYIIIEHEDFRSARLLTELYPQAIESKTFLDGYDEIYARAFRVPIGTRPARAPKYPFQASWPAIDLIGYDLDKAIYESGEIVYLQLWWHATARPGTNWTVFTHLLGPIKDDGNPVWAGHDATPGESSIPTTAWSAGDLVLDEYQIRLPEQMPAGMYQIEIGLYDPAAGGTRAATNDPPGQDHLILDAVRIGTP